MTKQYHNDLRDAWLDTYESEIGTAPLLRLCTGSPPASCATAQSGTQLIQMTLPSDWMAAPSSGTAVLAGTWSGTVSADGTAGYYRFLDSGATKCYEQGTVTRAFALTTSAATSSPSNVLTFTSTSGISVGMSVTATGVPSGATVSAVGATTVTLSVATSGVSSGATVYFGDTSGDLWLNNTALTTGTTLTITVRSLTAPGA